MSAFERFAVQRLLDQAKGLGVDVGGLSASSLCQPGGSYAARAWAHEHPDDDPMCCYAAMAEPANCTCWAPVYEGGQAEPRPPQSAEDLLVQRRMCGDCAFRPGSQERSDEWSEEALYHLAATGKPFWCHDGMRRPVRWEHPDGRVIDGDPDDWKPPIVSGIPYRADGRPGLLCAGWMAVAASRSPVAAVSDQSTNEEQW